MGRIQEFRMERAKRAFKEEMFPGDKARSFYVDYAGNAIGFAIERFDGNVLYYNAETGHYKPNQQNFEIHPEDRAVNVPPYEYRDGKRIEAGAANTKIEYLYRDADNYKVWNKCVIEGTLTQEQKQQILDCRFDGEWFIPHMVGLSEKQFDKWDEQSDHPYFELFEDSFEETTSPPTVNVSAEELLAAFEKCKELNWAETPMRIPSLSDRIAAAEATVSSAGVVPSFEKENNHER